MHMTRNHAYPHGYRGFESLPLRQAGVIQWQNRSFPCFLRGFDSLRPLHFFLGKLYRTCRTIRSISETDMFCILRNQRTCTVRPFHDKHSALRKIVLPTNLKNILLVVQTVEIHMYDKKSIGGMLRHNAERGTRHRSLRPQCGAKPLRVKLLLVRTYTCLIPEKVPKRVTETF